MGLDYEILEEQYNKLAAEKAAVEARTDLSDEERANALAGMDRGLEGLQSGILALGTKAKEEIQSAIKGLEEKLAANEEYIKAAEEELALRKAEIEAEMAKEKPDQGVIDAKNAEISALEKRIKSLKTATRKVQKEIKEQNKLLIPLMKRFKDKGLFTDKEIADLEDLDKKVERAKKAAETRRKKKEAAEKGETDKEEKEAEEKTEADKEEKEVEEKTEADKEEKEVEEKTETDKEEKEVEEKTEVDKEEKELSAHGGSYVVGGEDPIMEEVLDELEAMDNKKPLKDEFNELYKKAKKGTLEQADYTRLSEIMSDPENYDKLGITTGVLFNKSKVVLKAMGKFATKNVHKTVSGARNVFGLSTLKPIGNITATNTVMTWAGIKSIADKANVKLASQEVFERVVATAEEVGVDNLSEEERNVYDVAVSDLANLQGLRKTMDTYTEVKARRKEERWAWLKGKKTPTPLKAAPVEEKTVDDGSDIELTLGDEEPVVGDKTIESEEKTVTNSDVVFEYEYTPQPTDIFFNLKENVVPPEEIKEEAPKTKESDEKTVETDFSGPGIDG